MAVSSDSRTQHTRTILKDSLSTLLKERKYSNISIQLILEKANVSRSTFYGHFPSKNALLYSLEDELPIQLEAALLEKKGTNLLGVLFHHAETSYTSTQKGLLEVMLPEIDYWVRKYMKAYCKRTWRKYPQLELWQTVAVAGISSLLKGWLEQGAKDRTAVVSKANELLFCCLESAQ